MFTADLNQELITEASTEDLLDIRMFLRILRTYFCVASGGIGKLYTQFELQKPQPSLKAIIAKPDNTHTGIEGIHHRAIESVPVYIMDGHSVGLKGLALSIHEGEEISILPLQDGLEVLDEMYADDQGFLPVLATRQLRTIGNLSMVRLSRLRTANFSSATKSQVTRAINEKLGRLVAL